MNPAAACRREKEKHPWRYCSYSRCLWKLTNHLNEYKGPCKSSRHPYSKEREDADKARIVNRLVPTEV